LKVSAGGGTVWAASVTAKPITAAAIDNVLSIVFSSEANVIAPQHQAWRFLPAG
jgi:hypothetical protein